MTRQISIAIVLFGLLAVSNTAHASDREPTRAFSLTHAPTKLLISSVMINGEMRLGRKHGLAATAMVGTPKNMLSSTLGGSYRFYPIGDFDRGMQLGCAFAWSSNNELQNLLGPSFVSAFIGGKFTLDPGLTIEFQVSPSFYDNEIDLNGGFGIGWSFGTRG
jgi:hypothetical protein